MIYPIDVSDIDCFISLVTNLVTYFVTYIEIILGVSREGKIMRQL